MAKITRKTQKILGVNSSNTGIFGNAQKGIYDQYSQDPDVIQTPEWESGWNQATFSGAKFPPLEERQAVDLVVTRQIAYVLQEGIPEWDSGTEYHENSIVKESGTTNLYYSITDNNIGNPLSDSGNWTQFSFGVSDGDKGDVTVSASGNTWTVNNDAITTAKISDKNVTLPKIQDISTRKLLGRTTAGTGVTEQVDFIDDPTFLTATDINVPSALSVREFVDNKVNSTAIIQQSVPSGTTQAAYPAGGWRTVLINSKPYDPDNITSVSSNSFQLTAGTYKLIGYGSSGGATGSKGRFRFFNVTDSTAGIQSPNYGTPDNTGSMPVVDFVTIESTKTFRLEIYPTATTTATPALSTGDDEVYSTIIIEKLK